MLTSSNCLQSLQSSFFEYYDHVIESDGGGKTLDMKALPKTATIVSGTYNIFICNTYKYIMYVYINDSL